jgi:hypothetical protein
MVKSALTSRLPEWRNGRRAGLKIRWPRGREGSSPSSGTNVKVLQTGALRATKQEAPSDAAGGFGSSAAAVGYERASSIAFAAWSRMFGSTWE